MGPLGVWSGRRGSLDLSSLIRSLMAAVSESILSPSLFKSSFVAGCCAIAGAMPAASAKLIVPAAIMRPSIVVIPHAASSTFGNTFALLVSNLLGHHAVLGVGVNEL